MKKLSVIIPVYSASRYIEHCLQSVEAQTLRDIEVILVDDHGQDESIAKAKDFAAKSQRMDIRYVFVQTPTNSGPAVARNIGIEQAQGEYIAFLDADDWIEPEMYEVLYKQSAVSSSHSADLSCCNALQENENGQPCKALENPKVPNGVFAIATKKHFLSTFVAYFWTFIYRREWLNENEIRFADAKSSEDSSFLACCVLVADRIAQTDAPYYHYIIHSGSLTQRKVWKGRDKRKAFGEMWAFAKRQGLRRTYWPQLLWIYVKKALLVPIIEMIK